MLIKNAKLDIGPILIYSEKIHRIKFITNVSLTKFDKKNK